MQIIIIIEMEGVHLVCVHNEVWTHYSEKFKVQGTSWGQLKRLFMADIEATLMRWSVAQFSN